MLKSVSITGLFGRFNHHVELDRENNLTILTAPNGYGKTAVLSLIYNFFRREFVRLRSQHFHELIFVFDGGNGVRVAHEAPDLFGKPSEERKSVLLFSPINSQEAAWVFDASGLLAREDLATVERFLPFLTRMGLDRWMDDRTGDVYSTVNVQELFADMLPERYRKVPSLPGWLSQITASNECHLIETQRLLEYDPDPDAVYRRGRSIPLQSVVERNAKHLASLISTVLQTYAIESQKIEQSFPQRVLQQLGRPNPAAEDQIRSRLGALDSKIAALVAAGLIDKTATGQIAPGERIGDPYTRNLLSVYADDTERKLSIFDDIHDRIKVFQDIINSHFTFKTISIDAKRGILIVGDDNVSIPLRSLSSGEQHELVLIYELLFKVRRGAIILIDEPELSLHVAWQKRFIADLERVQKLIPLNIVLATHSPQIINDRWDLVVELKAGK